MLVLFPEGISLRFRMTVICFFSLAFGMVVFSAQKLISPLVKLYNLCLK